MPIIEIERTYKTVEEIDLKNCPFCGGDNLTYAERPWDGGGMRGAWASIRCGDCEAKISREHSTDLATAKIAVIHAWNRRREPIKDKFTPMSKPKTLHNWS